jgi:hypothetical protein
MHLWTEHEIEMQVEQIIHLVAFSLVQWLSDDILNYWILIFTICWQK